MKWIKYLSLTISLFTMSIGPVAQGAAAATAAKASPAASLNYEVSKEDFREFMKMTGLSAKPKMTVGEFYQKMRPHLFPRMQEDFDEWVRINRNELMPTFDATTYKDSSGKEQLRIIMSKDSKVVTVSINPENSAKYVKVNNVNLTKLDIFMYEQALRKIAAGDKMLREDLLKAEKTTVFRANPVLGFEEFKRLTPYQRAEYLMLFRSLLDEAQRVKVAYGKEKAEETAMQMDRRFEELVRLVFGEEAEAAQPKDTQSCITAGFKSTYRNGSCGISVDEKSTFGPKCPSGQTKCNPLLYGLQSNGKSWCVGTARSTLKFATENHCNKVAPNKTTEDKKKIIESIMKAKGQEISLVFNEEGKVHNDQLKKIQSTLDALNKYVDEAKDICDSDPLKGIRQSREDQDSACRGIATRNISILGYGTENEPEAVPPVLTAAKDPKDCEKDYARGSIYNREKDTCGCPSGTDRVDDGKGGYECLVPGGGAADDKPKECSDKSKEGDKDKNGKACVVGAGWWKTLKKVALPAVGVGLLGFFIWKMTRKDKPKAPTTPVYVPPCPPSPAPCVPPPVAPPVPPVVNPPAPPVVGTPDPGTIPTPVFTPGTLVEPTDNIPSPAVAPAPESVRKTGTN